MSEKIPMRGVDEDSNLEKAKNKILSFEEYSDRREEFTDPYVFEVENGGKRLVCIGAEHTSDPENPQFDLIKDTYSQADPDLVYVEGVSVRSLKNASEEKKEKFLNYSYESVVKEAGESLATVWLAMKDGVEVDSPEPSDKLVFEHLLSIGFSKEEIFLYYILRMVPQWDDRGGEKSFEEDVKLVRENVCSQLELECDKDLYSQIEDYLGGMGIDARREDFLDSEKVRSLVNPTFRNDRVRTNINNVAASTSLFRDQHILSRLKEAFEKHDTVFVVYGSAHIHMMEEAFEVLMKEVV